MQAATPSWPPTTRNKHGQRHEVPPNQQAKVIAMYMQLGEGDQESMQAFIVSYDVKWTCLMVLCQSL